jgi:predicted DNA-binding transcriptional regulator AlpA
MKYLRFPDLVDLGIVNNRMTLSRWIKAHGFPRPIALGPNTRAWRAEDVERWLAEREAA